MAKPVKRAYVSLKREEQAKTTRAAILTAARDLFVGNGYAATSIQAIADEAGVAVQTVYAVFGNKRALVDELIESAIVGDDVAGDAAAAIVAEPDARRRVTMDAALSRQIVERVAPIVRVAREAAAVDPEFAAVFEEMKARRRTEMTTMAKVIAGRDKLRLPAQTAAATLYILYSPDVADMLMGDYGWSAEKYERWLADALYQLLLAG